jgi:BirA family transcriptional regulator, biotin operon repressor / biotin---[acetyl-CoA-carboxylase] ligase
MASRTITVRSKIELVKNSMPPGDPFQPFGRDQVGALLAPGPVSWSVRYKPSTDSTQDLARAAAVAGAAEGWTIVTDWQRQGRGRLGRQWVATAGRDLLFSSVLRPPGPLLSLLPLLAGLAVAEGLRAETGLCPDLKWPNDLLANQRKLAGILLERGAGGAAVLGVGVNVNSVAVELPPGATSLKIVLGGDVNRERLLAAVLGAIGHNLARAEREGTAWIVPGWRTSSTMLGQRISYQRDGTTRAAIAEEIEGDGALRIRLDDGTRERLYAGEVHTMRSEP